MSSWGEKPRSDRKSFPSVVRMAWPGRSSYERHGRGICGTPSSTRGVGSAATQGTHGLVATIMSSEEPPDSFDELSMAVSKTNLIDFLKSICSQQTMDQWLVYLGQKAKMVPICVPHNMPNITGPRRRCQWAGPSRRAANKAREWCRQVHSRMLAPVAASGVLHLNIWCQQRRGARSDSDVTLGLQGMEGHDLVSITFGVPGGRAPWLVEGYTCGLVSRAEIFHV
jgi:hypothetical protein